MTEDIAQLGLAVESGQVRTATRDMDRMTASAKGLEATTGLLTKAMGLLGAALSVTQLIRMTSVWTDLNSRVRNAVSAHESATQVMNRIDEMARRTYSSLEQTADSYLRNASALDALGYTTSEQLDLTESLNNALVISAIKGQAAESVMNAWSKAMALGKLNGENLNTIIMSGGRVSEALADSMGVSVLELRKLGEEGKITGDKMFGITSQLEKLREEADAMPATIQDAFTLLNNALLSTIGRLDEATGASTAIADAIIAVGDNIDVLIPIVGALAGIITAALIPALWGAVAAGVAFAATPFGMLIISIGALAGAVAYLWNEQRKGEQAAKDHAAAIDANSKAIEVARTASQNFRQDLRDQIAMQLEAAKAAATEADAQYLAARAKAVSQRFQLFGMKFGNAFAEADADAKFTTAMAMDKLFVDLEDQMRALDQIMTTPAGKDEVRGGGGLTDPDALKEAEKAAQALQETFNTMFNDVRPLIEDANDPFIELQSNMDKLGALLNAGQIGWDDYAKAVERANLHAASSVLGSVGQITGILSGMFEDNKLLAAANAAINTAEGVTKALAQGGMFAIPMAAAIGAAGALQIATIMSTRPGNAGVTSPSANAAATAPASTTAAPAQSVNVTLQGQSYGRDQIRGLLEQIGEALGDGMTLKVVN